MSLTTVIIGPLAVAVVLIVLGLILDTLGPRLTGASYRATTPSSSHDPVIFATRATDEIALKVRRN
jgi:hypothetical protein